MRRIIRLLSLCTAAAWLVLCLPCIALASGYDGESVLLLATDKLSTRNGPGTFAPQVEGASLPARSTVRLAPSTCGANT